LDIYTTLHNCPKLSKLLMNYRKTSPKLAVLKCAVDRTTKGSAMIAS
jgi:hypothetical protein